MKRLALLLLLVGAMLGLAAQAGAGDIDGARATVRELQHRHATVAEVVADEADRMALVAALDREFTDLERVVGDSGTGLKQAAKLYEHLDHQAAVRLDREYWSH